MLKNFLGLVKEEAIQLFQTTPTSEDFSYMRYPGLIYYLEAAFEYLKSDEVAHEEFDFPTGLLCSLSCQVSIWKVDKSAIPLIKEIAEYCEQNTKKLDIDEGSGLCKEYISTIKNA